MDEAKPHNQALHREYRSDIEKTVLVDAIRNASLLFIVLQTLVFIPADWLLHSEHFGEFLGARLLENGFLAFVYFKWSRVNAVHATVFTALTGSTLFLFMVHLTGGVESGYYVGLILLLVGIAVIAPLSGRQSGLIAASICLSYASLPWTSHSGKDVNWPIYFQHFFFLGSAAIEAALACTMMDRMRFKDFCQKRELISARDELAEMDKVKSRFSANVHHELRTPLTLILSPLDALRSGEFGEVPESISRTLDTMHSNGRRLHKMINNLLDLSKLENRQFSILRRPTRIDRLVTELVTGASPMADRKQVTLVCHGFEAPLEIAIDGDAIEKVLINLIGNALKFTGNGGRISVDGIADADGVTIQVTDTGIGIPPDQLDSIFDRFAQVDSSTTRNYEGTGIGLSLAQEMVHLHQGKIWAKSAGEGHGTTVSVWLPNGMSDAAVEEVVLADNSGRQMDVYASIAAIEADLNIEVEEEAEFLGDVERQLMRDEDYGPVGDDSYRSILTSKQHESKPEVLIAEDNPDMRHLLQTLIGKHYSVRVAKNGRQALEKIRHKMPDLVLSDIMMPEMDGIELCRQIKNSDDTKSLPVVLVTSKAENEMKIEGLELGADDYITKPFHPRELLARVGSLIRSSILRRELSERNTQLGEALEDLKRAEVMLVQNERLAAVGELAAGIAHEVNNPVNFALNAARMLSANAQEMQSLIRRMPDEKIDVQILSQRTRPSNVTVSLDELGKDAIELTDIISQGLERTHSLVTDLKNFAAPADSGRARGRMCLTSCLRSAATLIGPTLSQSTISLDIQIVGEPPDILANEGAIGQVILNLFKNASDAIGITGGTIVAKIESVEHGVSLSISDDGPGISEVDRNQIFEPFFTTKPAGEGTGLGLAISKQIILEHSGTIEIESELGVGSTFRIKLPSS